MGLFKDLGRMKDSVESAPGRIKQAQEMAAQAQQMAAAQQAAGAAQMANFQNAAAAPAAAPAAAGAGTDPIAGVSLELYAEISRELAGVGYDQTQAPQIAASKGVSGESWQAALDGWNERIKTNPAVAQEFNRLYTQG